MRTCPKTTKRLPLCAVNLRLPSFHFGSNLLVRRCLPQKALCFFGTLALRTRTCFLVRVWGLALLAAGLSELSFQAWPPVGLRHELQACWLICCAYSKSASDACYICLTTSVVFLAERAPFAAAHTDTWRHVVYCCYQPRKLASPQDLRLKQYAYKERRVSLPRYIAASLVILIQGACLSWVEPCMGPGLLKELRASTVVGTNSSGRLDKNASCP